MKTCRRCRRHLPSEDFGSNPKLRDGLHSWCRDCMRDAVRRSRARHGGRYNAERRGSVRRKAGPARAIAADPLCAALLDVVAGDPCAYCGRPAGPGRELDHIEPIAAGGPDTAENFTATCRDCNTEKQDDPLLIFLLKRRIRAKLGARARGGHGYERIARELAGQSLG